MQTKEETVADLLILPEDAVDLFDRIPVITLADVLHERIAPKHKAEDEIEVMQAPHLYDLI
jgi:hypothetical protein